MKNENKITVNNLIYALLFFVFGIVLLTSTEDLISIASKVIGIILIIIGIVKTIVYIYMKGKLGNYKLSELILGLSIICFGSLLILYSGVLSFVIRIIVGLWVLFSGINRMVLAISIKSIDKNGFRVYLITSILMILISICLISGLFEKILGLFIVVYSITEVVNYIYFKTKNKNYDAKAKQNQKSVNGKLKKLKEKKVVDAIIEE